MSAAIKELHASLEAGGWRFGPALGNTGVSWYAWRRLDGIADCACNDKAPSLILAPYELTINDQTHASVEFEISGEVQGGRWVNLKAYSVPLSEALQAVPECTRILSAAWSAAAAPLPAEQPSNPDAARLDWLEQMGNEAEGLLLHDGGDFTGRRGLGLRRIGRSIRQAIDQAMPRIVGQQTKGGSK